MLPADNPSANHIVLDNPALASVKGTSKQLSIHHEESHGETDPVPAPVVNNIAAAVPTRKSIRSKRKPVRFADEYDKYYR